MKYQVLFTLKNNEKVFKSAAVVIGALRCKFHVVFLVFYNNALTGKTWFSAEFL